MVNDIPCLTGNRRFAMPKLYKMASTGKTQVWEVDVSEGGDGTAYTVVTYGQLDGKQQMTSTAIQAGKNIGRSNATTPYEQAISEASSKWKKQKDKGYGEDINVAKPEQKPMLAHEYSKYKHKVTWDDAYVQPKLDGIRCLARWENGEVKLYTRGNKPITTMKHIVEQVRQLYVDEKIPRSYTFDGELYIHGEKFQDIVSWVKREQFDTPRVEYHIYDIISPGNFSERFFYLCVNARYPSLKQVAISPVFSEDDLQRFHDSAVINGYEGAMLRWGQCLYKEGYRSQQLLKFKSFIDEEFEIIGAREGDKGRSEGQCIYELKTKEGGVFKCNAPGNVEERKLHWLEHEENIGKMMTVRFFSWSTSAVPLPRFPIPIGIRDYD